MITITSNNSNTRSGKTGGAGLIMAFILVVSSLPLMNTYASDNRDAIKSTPVNYDTYLEFLGTGLFLSVDGGIFLDGLIDGDGMHWQRQIMRRTDEQIEEERQAAINYFQTRYGVQIEGNDSIYFTGFEVDSRSDFRVYTFSGRDVPPEGWDMRIGGWGFFVFDPDGLTLGGEFQGQHVPRGAGVLFGDYNILADASKEIIIHYEMSQPLILNQFGGAVLEFDISSDEFGEGVSEGSRSTTVPDPSNPLLIQQDVKVVFSFPADGIIKSNPRHDD